MRRCVVNDDDKKLKELRTEINKLKTHLARFENEELKKQHSGNEWSSPHLIPVDSFGDYRPIK
jgi:hypothetical protein